MTPDPSNANVDLGNPGSWNRFAYTNGDPVNSNDPTGLDLWDDGTVCWGGGGGDPSIPSDGQYGEGITTLVGTAAQNYLNSVAASTGSIAATVASDYTITFPSPQSAYGNDPGTWTTDPAFPSELTGTQVALGILPPTGPTASSYTELPPVTMGNPGPVGCLLAPGFFNGLSPSPSDTSDGGVGFKVFHHNSTNGNGTYGNENGVSEGDALTEGLSWAANVSQCATQQGP